MEKTVCLNAFENCPNGDQSYIDMDNPESGETGNIAGYSVYLRIETPSDPQQPFDIPVDTDKDFSDYETAREYGEKLALDYKTEFREY